MPEKIDVNSTAIPTTPGRDELQVAPLPGLLKDRAEPEAEHQQIQQRLAERRDDLRRERRYRFTSRSQRM